MRNPTAYTASCTAQRRNGEFCDEPAGEGMPFPICVKHATRVYMEMRDRLNTRSPKLVTRGLGEIKDARARAEALRHEVVYYVGVGDVIKIGTTSDLPTRLSAYPPYRKLLATEPNTGPTEHLRHREFGEYLHSGREWFTPGPRLLEHIKALREQAA